MGYFNSLLTRLAMLNYHLQEKTLRKQCRGIMVTLLDLFSENDQDKKMASKSDR